MTMTSLTVSAAPGNSFQATRMQSTGATATGLVCLSLGLLLDKPYGRIPIECSMDFNKRMLNVASHLHMPAQKLTRHRGGDTEVVTSDRHLSASASCHHCFMTCC